MLILALAGAGLGLWGLWAIYSAGANYDSSSELPRWSGYAFGGFLLGVGVVLLAAGRAMHRRRRT